MLDSQFRTKRPEQNCPQEGRVREAHPQPLGTCIHFPVLTQHRDVRLLVLELLVLVCLGFLRLHLCGHWSGGGGGGWGCGQASAGQRGLLGSRQWGARRLLRWLPEAARFLLPFLLLLPHQLPLLSFPLNQRHSVFDGFRHGLVITFTDIPRLYLRDKKVGQEAARYQKKTKPI